MQIGFKWLDAGDSQGYMDFFEASTFSEQCENVFLVHPVVKPNGRFHALARCLLTVSGNQATLNYEAFSADNKFRNVLSGIAKLHFAQGSEELIFNVSWKGEHDSAFYECRTEYKTRKSASSSLDAINASHVEAIKYADELTNEELIELLPRAGSLPLQVAVTTKAFLRNPYVVVAARRRAKGKCEECESEAPFTGRNGQPFLEVHHKIPLSDGGTDDLQNTLAVCPNCHRKFHYGEQYAT